MSQGKYRFEIVDGIERLKKNLANASGIQSVRLFSVQPEEYWSFPADSNKLVIANHSWWNRYGFPAHLEPRKQIGAAAKRFRS